MNLIGYTATFKTSSGRSLWVTNNHYEVFEVPSFTNHSQYKAEGDFLVFAHNTDFDYWVLTRLKYSINLEESKRKMKVVDRATYIPIGMYNVSTNGQYFHISKKKEGRYIDFGALSKKRKFDSIGSRKNSFGCSEASIVAKLNNYNHNSKALSGGNRVAVYKKKNNNKSE